MNKLIFIPFTLIFLGLLTLGLTVLLTFRLTNETIMIKNNCKVTKCHLLENVTKCPWDSNVTCAFVNMTYGINGTITTGSKYLIANLTGWFICPRMINCYYIKNDLKTLSLDKIYIHPYIPGIFLFITFSVSLMVPLGFILYLRYRKDRESDEIVNEDPEMTPLKLNVQKIYSK